MIRSANICVSIDTRPLPDLGSGWHLQPQVALNVTLQAILKIAKSIARSLRKENYG